MGVRVREDVITEADVRERFEDATLPALMLKEGITGQGIGATLGSWKRQEKLPHQPRAFRRNTAIDTLM